MIPSGDQITALWDKYHLSGEKRRHVTLVARVAIFFASRIQQTSRQYINEKLLWAAALLHDIDKGVSPKPGERHPDTAVRILTEEGMYEVAEIVRRHPLHAIVDSAIRPVTWEEKLLFLADKMVKYEILTVDKRFQLWRAEDLPPEGRQLLVQSYPLVKKLEKEILELVGIQPDDVATLA